MAKIIKTIRDQYRSTVHEKRYLKIDKITITILVLLLIFSCMMVYSASMIGNKYGLFTGEPVSPEFFLKRQAGWIGLSLGVFLIISTLIPFELLKRPKVIQFTFFFVALLEILPLIGPSINGAKLWIRYGSFSFQPSTIAQIYIIVYMAYILDLKKEKLMKPCTSTELLSLFIYPLILAVILVFQNDTGTLILTLIVIAIIVMCSNIHVANIKKIILISTLATAFVAIPLFLGRLLFGSSGGSYRINRFKVFLNPFSEDLKGSADQIINSFIAFGNGGLTGQGIGNSVQKLGYLAEAHTDFILAVIAEEFGFVGVIVLLSLIVAIVLRVLNIGTKATTTFEALYAIGFASLILVQMLVNVGGVSASIPMTGVPLPFISNGGSSILSLCTGLGVAMNIYAHQRYLKKTKK